MTAALAGLPAAEPRCQVAPRGVSRPAAICSRQRRVTFGRIPLQHALRPAKQLQTGGRFRLVTAAAAQRGSVELLLENVAGNKELLSPKLDADVRQRAARAINQRGRRVTIGDVASSAGLRLEAAEEAVKALAADSQATLQVSDDGEIVYVFSPGFESAIASKSLLMRAEPVAKGIRSGVEYLLRVAFGTALVASAALVYAAIVVLMSSGSRDDNRNGGRSGGYGGGYYGGGGGYYYGGPRVYFDLADLFWYWDPYYNRNRRKRAVVEQQRDGMNFLEAVFSWVFGDGDPNADFDKQRWQAIGRYIAGRGGVVVAEELAPFLDLKPGELAADRGRVTVSEGYMLPVLARFNGSPQVDAQGNIIYTFPDLQTTATARVPAPILGIAKEMRWKLTLAAAGQRLGAVALGAFNLLGVGVLTLMLRDPVAQLTLARNGLLGVVGLMPWLQAYAAAYFAVPLVRWFQNRARNAGIDARNQAREEAAKLLQRPDATLAQKLATAAAAGKRRVITERDVVYRTDQALEDQPIDLQGEAFDARLEARTRERQPQQAQRPSLGAARNGGMGGGGGARRPQQASAPQWWLDQQAQQQRNNRGR